MEAVRGGQLIHREPPVHARHALHTGFWLLVFCSSPSDKRENFLSSSLEHSTSLGSMTGSSLLNRALLRPSGSCLIPNSFTLAASLKSLRDARMLLIFVSLTFFLRVVLFLLSVSKYLVHDVEDLIDLRKMLLVQRRMVQANAPG